MQDDEIICKQEQDALIIAAGPPHDAAIKAAMLRLRASIYAVLPKDCPRTDGAALCAGLLKDGKVK